MGGMLSYNFMSTFSKEKQQKTLYPLPVDATFMGETRESSDLRQSWLRAEAYAQQPRVYTSHSFIHVPPGHGSHLGEIYHCPSHEQSFDISICHMTANHRAKAWAVTFLFSGTAVHLTIT